jgi:hypothetical protein
MNQGRFLLGGWIAFVGVENIIRVTGKSHECNREFPYNQVLRRFPIGCGKIFRASEIEDV